MELWVIIVSAAVPAAAVLLLAVFFILRRCRRGRELPSDAETGVKHRSDSLHAALAKLHLSYKSPASKSGANRFHHLHQSPHPIPHQRPPFNWDDNPRLISDAVEHGWPRFAFKNPLSTADTNWEVPLGSSEFMQTFRLNPGAADSCSARMSLPLPGPSLGGSSFPQEAYFEITILYLQHLYRRRRHHRSPRASKRGKNGEGDRAKLIKESSLESENEVVALSPIKDPELDKEEGDDGYDPSVISVGFTVEGSLVTKPMMPGSYPDSIGFNSDGSVYLDGMKLVAETGIGGWAGVNKVFGCGFDPSKQKIFITVDSELVHVIHCSSDVFKNPLYPIVTVANADVMVLVNLGQSLFKYEPANAHRTPNPCFLRTPNDNAVVLGLIDSRELFSMRRIDSEWLDPNNQKSYYRKNSKGKKSNGNISDDSFVMEFYDIESDLFEIALHN